MKKLTLDDLKLVPRPSMEIPISDKELEADPTLPPYYHPGVPIPRRSSTCWSVGGARRIPARPSAADHLSI
jgi:hypothetical protein